MEQEKIDRISQLTRLARARALTPQEEAERAALRREYMDAVKGSLTAQLDRVYYVDQAGGKEKLRRKEN